MRHSLNVTRDDAVTPLVRGYQLTTPRVKGVDREDITDVTRHAS
jgi:hypothetical protein